MKKVVGFLFSEKLNFVLEYGITMLVLVAILFLGALGIYGGLVEAAAGDLTWSILPIWIWTNRWMLYWSVAAISAGHCAAYLFAKEAVGEEFGKDNKKEEKTEEERQNESIAQLMMISFSGFLWLIYWSYILFYPIYKWIIKRKKERENV